MAQKVSMREVYGKTLVELGKENPDIVVLNADVSCSTMTHFFAQELPKRFFNCGAAEGNMIGIAAGLAVSNKIPFATTYAVFAPGRCFDQIRISIAQPKLNVKIVVSHGGISVGADGASHQGIEDLSLIGALPGFNVIVPTDSIEAAQVVRTAVNNYGPFYIRLCRSEVPLVYSEDYRFVLGKAATMKQGDKVTIIAIGIMVSAALEAANSLKGEGEEIKKRGISPS